MNTICHWEMQTVNPENAKKFYEPLFGWKLTHEKEMGYVMVETGGQPDGGMNVVGKIEPSATLFYVMVDDIEAILVRAEKLGGAIVTPKKPIPHVGHFGVLRDIEGNQVGLFTPLPR